MERGRWRLLGQRSAPPEGDDDVEGAAEAGPSAPALELGREDRAGAEHEEHAFGFRAAEAEVRTRRGTSGWASILSSFFGTRRSGDHGGRDMMAAPYTGLGGIPPSGYVFLHFCIVMRVMLAATIMKVWREGLAYLGDNCRCLKYMYDFGKRLSIQHPHWKRSKPAKEENPQAAGR